MSKRPSFLSTPSLPLHHNIKYKALMLMEEHISGGSCVMTVMPLDETDPATTSNRRSCMDCQATSTPCWRSGPAGPRTLCNACGIRYRKRRRAILGLREGVEKKKKEEEEEEKEGRVYLKEELWKRRKMGEEERAAILLMALSCGGGSAFV